jgi:hypothetical protein
MYQAIFIGLFVVGWLVCAYVPWLALSIATRGNAGLGNLPLCLLAGLAGGFAVPLLILDDANGLWLSFVMAAALPSLLLVARRISLAAHAGNRRAAPPPAVPEPAAVENLESEIGHS